MRVAPTQRDPSQSLRTGFQVHLLPTGFPPNRPEKRLSFPPAASSPRKFARPAPRAPQISHRLSQPTRNSTDAPPTSSPRPASRLRPLLFHNSYSAYHADRRPFHAPLASRYALGSLCVGSLRFDPFIIRSTGPVRKQAKDGDQNHPELPRPGAHHEHLRNRKDREPSPRETRELITVRFHPE